LLQIDKNKKHYPNYKYLSQNGLHISIEYFRDY